MRPAPKPGMRAEPMTDQNAPVTVKEPGVAIGGLGITRQIKIDDNDQIAFETAIDATTDIADLMQVFDLINEAVRRERAKSELPRRKQAVEIARKMPLRLDEEIAELTRQKMAQQAGYRAAWELKGKRSEYRETDAQKQSVAQFDQRIENALKSRSTCATHIMGAEWEVARREAIIRGEEEPLPPSELIDMAAGMAMSEAAD
jgi:hypothetical protein